MAGISLDNTEIAFRSKSDRELRRACRLFWLLSYPALVRVGSVLTRLALAIHFPIGWIIRRNIFAHFCGGENIPECSGTTQSLQAFGIGTILDYSVEGKDAEDDLDGTCEEICRTIRTAHGREDIPFCVFKVTGIARFALLEKVNAHVPLDAAENEEWRRVHDRVETICSLAASSGTPVLIDAEDSWIQDAIDGLAEVMMQRFNRDSVMVYTTIQLYRHDRLAYLKGLHKRAVAGGFGIGVKLVRGAYMEKERARAAELGFVDPIQPDKEASDRDFDLALEYCVANLREISICCGSHNEASSLHLTKLMAAHGIEPADRRVYFAQLLGMSDHISFNLASAGYRVAKYVPYGPIREVIPYLLRRAQENTSVKGQTGRELSLITKELARRKAR
ncbi:MAG: proline dehydrogenase family protein [Flavobacteriales bacterium]|jgi:proline dehydrogenase